MRLEMAVILALTGLLSGCASIGRHCETITATHPVCRTSMMGITKCWDVRAETCGERVLDKFLTWYFNGGAEQIVGMMVMNPSLSVAGMAAAPKTLPGIVTSRATKQFAEDAKKQGDRNAKR